MIITLRSKYKEQPKAKMHIAHYLFLLFWVLKPFYFGQSGTMQVADLVFVASFGASIVVQRGRIIINHRDLVLLAFIGCVFVINGIYAAVYQRIDFLFSSAYYLYNFLVVITIRQFLDNRTFLKALLWASALALFTQLAVLFLGTGRYMWGIYRFMGTFNDPNQFAFSMFTSFLIVYVLSSYFKEMEKTRKKFLVVLIFILSVYFVTQGSSTGMLLGMGTFVIAFFALFIASEKTPFFVFLRVVTLMLVLILILYAIFVGFSTDGLDNSVGSGSFLVFRLFEKVGKVESGGVMALLEDRAIDKVFENPVYMLFGSGEGGHTRFPGPAYEVHSTLLGILFYYGIFPFLFLCVWMRRNLKHMSRMLVPAYLALLIESFTLANQRQPAFWILIVLGSLAYANHRELRKYRIVTTL